jgi:hypothetical protein
VARRTYYSLDSIRNIAAEENDDGSVSLFTATVQVQNEELAAGESHIGEVGGSSTVIEVTPTISASPAYSIGDSIGGKIQLAGALRVSGKAALLQSIMIIDRDNQKPSGQLILFNADPTVATLTDNTAVALSTDAGKIVARVPVLNGDYATINGMAFANLSNLGRIVAAASGTMLWLAFVTDSTPDFAANNTLTLQFGFLRD